MPALSPVALGRHRMAVDMPDDAEFSVQAQAGYVEHPMIWGMVAVDPGDDLGDGESAIVNRRPWSGDAAHQAEAGLRLVRRREGRGPNPVDQRGVEVIDRPVGVEIAARK